MNCHTFSDLAGDIARHQMMDASAQAQALAHADSCVSCAAQLRSQQQLTSDLGELASATKDETASPIVWEQLSIAFDSRTITHPRTNRRGRIYAASAIAAMLILAFAVIQLVRPRQTPNVEAMIAATFTALPSQTSEGRDTVVFLPENRKPQVLRHRRSPAPKGSTLPVSQPKEIATDFILLTYDESDLGSEAQMVRVELPRSAMASFGLPVNMDRADQRVKADILMSADGLARAIRFVQ